MAEELMCPRCGEQPMTQVVGGFLERGPYGTDMLTDVQEALGVTDGRYADQQGVTGYRCAGCDCTICLAELDKRFDKPQDWDTMTVDEAKEKGLIDATS